MIDIYKTIFRLDV